MEKSIYSAAATSLVRGLISFEPGNHQENLRKVQSLREFLCNPEGNEDLQKIPASHGVDPQVQPWTPYSAGDLVTQRIQADGSFGYLVPIPGQPALVLGCPKDFSLDGAVWDSKNHRWSGVDDVRVLVNTPEGPRVVDMESSRLVPHYLGRPEQEHQIQAELLRATHAVLDDLEEKIQASITTAEEKAAQASQEGAEHE